MSRCGLEISHRSASQIVLVDTGLFGRDASQTVSTQYFSVPKACPSVGHEASSPLRSRTFPGTHARKSVKISSHYLCCNWTSVDPPPRHAPTTRAGLYSIRTMIENMRSFNSFPMLSLPVFFNSPYRPTSWRSHALSPLPLLYHSPQADLGHNHALARSSGKVLAMLSVRCHAFAPRPLRPSCPFLGP